MLSSTTPIHINLQKIKRNRHTKKYKKKQKTNPKTKCAFCQPPSLNYNCISPNLLKLESPLSKEASQMFFLIQTSMYKKQLQNFIFKFLPKSHSSWSRRKKKERGKKKKRKRKDEQAGVQEWLRAF